MEGGREERKVGWGGGLGWMGEGEEREQEIDVEKGEDEGKGRGGGDGWGKGKKESERLMWRRERKSEDEKGIESVGQLDCFFSTLVMWLVTVAPLLFLQQSNAGAAC